MSEHNWGLKDYVYAFFLASLYVVGVILLIEGFVQDVWNGKVSNGLTWLEFAAGLSLVIVAIKLSYDKVYYDYYRDSE